MAVQGTLGRPYPELTALTLKRVSTIPVGDLRIPYVAGAPPRVESAIRAGRFPTPSAALGFLTSVRDEEGEFPYAIPPLGLESPYIIGGALFPESDFLESTKGQIWPRIG